MQQHNLRSIPSGEQKRKKKEITIMYAAQYKIQKQMKLNNKLVRYKYSVKFKENSGNKQ